ncbi:hypothetical protein COLO4_31365 [Corchorus olitorius]|uniref:Uncharacterized protein n=1 Tax=Corchorus olitorius TaxID=93759 RepID=A0A1R3H4M7_9ROSI|nr:hypothetical protein COLO4_31365 [Corchorus olitorius]
MWVCFALFKVGILGGSTDHRCLLRLQSNQANKYWMWRLDWVHAAADTPVEVDGKACNLSPMQELRNGPRLMVLLIQSHNSDMCSLIIVYELHHLYRIQKTLTRSIENSSVVGKRFSLRYCVCCLQGHAGVKTYILHNRWAPELSCTIPGIDSLRMLLPSPSSYCSVFFYQSQNVTWSLFVILMVLSLSITCMLISSQLNPLNGQTFILVVWPSMP